MARRVGIDCHVVDGIYQGSRTYLIELLSRIIPLARDIDFYLFLDNTSSLAAYSECFSMRNVKLVRMPSTNPVNRLARVLPRMQKEYGLELLHTQYISPVPSYSPCVVTIHDILFESHPQFFPSIFKLRSRLMVRHSATKAAHLFTGSEFSKTEIMSRYKIDENGITVTSYGINRGTFFPGSAGKEIVERRGLTPGKYILTVGRLEPRKNHHSLLKAYSILGPDVPDLVIAGQRDHSFKAIFVALKKLRLIERVKIIDDLDDSELASMYRHASLLVYPSWAEGFGFPPLEAMASGVPVISSDNTALPEVTGDAAILVEPSDAARLAATIKQVLGSEDLRRVMIEKGLRQSMKFSWEDAAKKTLGGYENALKLS